MTKRSVYLPKATRPFFKRKEISCEFAPDTRKSKRAQTVCDAWQALHPEQSILDVSIHSPSESGQKLARENLSLRLATLRKAFCVSTIELASKTFKNGGPYVDLLGTPLKEAKNDPRLKDSGKIVHYSLKADSIRANRIICTFTGCISWRSWTIPAARLLSKTRTPSAI